MTRYQILFPYEACRPVENFRAEDFEALHRRVTELRRTETKFSVWDTRSNPLSDLFRMGDRS